MIGLLPCNRLINGRVNRYHAGKSRQVDMCLEAHEKQSGRGLRPLSEKHLLKHNRRGNHSVVAVVLPFVFPLDGADDEIGGLQTA